MTQTGETAELGKKLNNTTTVFEDDINLKKVFKDSNRTAQ